MFFFRIVLPAVVKKHEACCNCKVNPFYEKKTNFLKLLCKKQRNPCAFRVFI